MKFLDFRKAKIGTLLTVGIVTIIGLMISASIYSTYLSNKAQTIIRTSTTRIFDVLTIQRDLEELFSATADLDTVRDLDRLEIATEKIGALHKRALNTVEDGEERGIFEKSEAEEASEVLEKVSSLTENIIAQKKEMIDKTGSYMEYSKEYDSDDVRELDKLFFSLRTTRFELLGIFHEITMRSDEQYNRVMDLVYDAQRITWVVVATSSVLALLLGYFLVRSTKKIFDMKNEFINIIAHDLRNPVAAILGYLEMITDEKDKIPTQLHEGIQAIEVSAQKLRSQINNLLEVGRTEAGHIKLNLEPVVAFEVIDESVLRVKAFAEISGIKISDEKSTGKGQYVFADRSKLSDVLDNLISNAIKYNKKKGTVTVTTQDVGEMLNISVTDTGHGIPENQKKKMFKKYSRLEQSKEKDVSGTGLGLYTVKLAMDKMSGTVTYKTKVDVGTTFTIGLKKVKKKETSS